MSISSGLIAYYPFSNNANDATGNGHDGIVQNPVNTPFVVDRSGNLQSAVSFDGNNADFPSGAISVPASNSFNLVNSSWCAWFKDDAALGVGHRCIFSYADSNMSRNGIVLITQSDGQLQLHCKSNIENPNGPATSLSYRDGQWHHVVVTLANVSVGVYTENMYVDGSKVIGPSNVNFLFNPLNPVRFGQSADTNGSPSYWSKWQGSLDSIKIYDRILSAIEVSGLYEISDVLLYTYVPRAPITKRLGSIRPIIMNCNPYPSRSSSNDKLKMKIELYDKNRLSYKQLPFELWMNYSGSWFKAGEYNTTRFGNKTIDYPCDTISGVTCCQGFARVYVDDKPYDSNTVRFNFIQR